MGMTNEEAPNDEGMTTLEARTAVFSSRCADAVPSASCRRRHSYFVILSSFVIGHSSFVLTGCVTHADHLRDIRSAYFAGDLDQAEKLIDVELRKRRGDANVLKLDRAMIELCAGRPAEAERLLREVRDQFDHLEQRDAAEETLSLLTDDQRRAYAGEDYEKILVRVFLALANLMTDGQDAAAYALQVAAKQQEIIQAGCVGSDDNPKLAYQRVAAGAYINAVLHEASHSNYDDAERAILQVAEWQPDFRFKSDDYERVRFGRHSAPGHGVLYVFALVGRGPHKEEAVAVPTSAALLVADRILSVTGKHTLPPTIAPIKVPRVVSGFGWRGISVSVDGESPRTTETITDIGQIAVQQAEAIAPQVLGRAIARRVVKKGAIYATKEAVNRGGNPLAEFGLDVVGIAWEATESADTRCWGLLPDTIQVLRIELPAGEHRISMCGAENSASIPSDSTEAVEIADGRNTYVLANFPAGKLAGRILVSQP
jgi:hypothetical protein